MKFFSKMKLAGKLTWVISVVVTVILGIILSYTVLSTGTVIRTTVFAEFNAIAKGNALQVQQIFDAADTAADAMASYLDKAYQVSINKKEADHTSSIYGQPITELSADVEKYIVETARNTVISNEDIWGIGVMFEPYKFDTNIRDYGFYIEEGAGGEVVKPYGAYAAYSKEPFYMEAAKTKETIFTEPYEHNGVMMISVGTPIIFDNTLQGVIVADIKVSNFDKVSTQNVRYPSMCAAIYDNGGTIIYDSNDVANVGLDMGQFYASKDELAAVEAKFAQGESFEVETRGEDGTKYARFFYPIKVGSDHWWALSALESKDMNEAVNRTTQWVLGMSSVGLLGIIIIVTTVVRKLLKPITGVVEAADSIAQGNFAISLQSDSCDELGELTRTFSHTALVLKGVIEDISHVLDNIADKNLDIETTANYVGDLGQIEKSIHRIIGNLNEAMCRIDESADQVANGADQIAVGAQALAQGATEQASSIQELSATIMEIAEQIETNAKNAQNANLESTKASGEIEESNKQMAEMVLAIGQISDKSNEIGKIIKTIEDIAFQTNILALNAAVEAARAGSAGKGFAVVADEVRNLASKSAEAAKNTTTLIMETISAVENGTKMADRTAQHLQAVVVDAMKITNLVNDIASASTEQALAIAQVNLGVEQIASVIQTNSATAEESAAAAEELSSQAQMLKDTVGEFHLQEQR